MMDTADKEATTIVDQFLNDAGAGDLYRLQEAIADALRRAYERGRSQYTGGRPTSTKTL